MASHEFDNAFTGGSAIPAVLTGARDLQLVGDVPYWRVSVESGLCDDGGSPSVCFLVPDGAPATSVQFNTLTVDSQLFLLNSAGTSVQHGFTVKEFDGSSADTTPIAVTAGQFVTVTVDLTFVDVPA